MLNVECKSSATLANWIPAHFRIASFRGMFEHLASGDVQCRDVVPIHLTDHQHKFRSESSEHREKGRFAPFPKYGVVLPLWGISNEFLNVIIEGDRLPELLSFFIVWKSTDADGNNIGEERAATFSTRPALDDIIRGEILRALPVVPVVMGHTDHEQSGSTFLVVLTYPRLEMDTVNWFVRQLVCCHADTTLKSVTLWFSLSWRNISLIPHLRRMF